MEQHSQQSNLSNFGGSKNPLNKMGSLFSLISNMDLSKSSRKLSDRRYSVPSLWVHRQETSKSLIIQEPLLETCIETSPENLCYGYTLESYPIITAEEDEQRQSQFRRIATTGKRLQEAGTRTLGQYATL